MTKTIIFLLTIFSALLLPQYHAKSLTIPLQKRHPPNLKNTLTQRLSSKLNLLSKDISLINYLNDQYMGTFYIGSNKQEVNLLFDTGSSWFWVGDSDTEFANTFDCDSSETCESDPTNIQTLSYGQGRGRGYMVRDQISLYDDFTVPSQAFVVATEVQELGTFYADGIVGLGPTGQSWGYPTFLDNLFEQGVIESRSFAMYMINDPSSYGQAAGKIEFGGYDPEVITEPLTFMSIGSEEHHWAINLSSITLGSTKLPLPEKPKAIIDSGTSLIMFPMATLRSVYNVLSSSGDCRWDENKYIFCSCNVDFPDMYINFEGYQAKLTKDLLMTRMLGDCMVQIHGLEYENYILLGDVFMRKYYTYFSAQNRTIGVAEAVEYEPSHPLRTLLILITIVLSCLLVYMPARDFLKVVKGRKSHYESLKNLSQRILRRKGNGNGGSIYRNGVKMTMQTTEIVNRAVCVNNSNNNSNDTELIMP